MSIYFVDPTNGSDGRTGAQAQVISTPWKSLNKALTTIVPSGSGDTVYVAPGVDRTLCAPTMTPTTSSPVTVIGDNANSQGFASVTPGEVTISAFLTNDTTAPSATALLTLGIKGFFTFKNLTFMGGTGGAVTCAAGSTNVTFTDCLFQSCLGNAIALVNSANTPIHYLIDRCIIIATASNGVSFTGAANTTSTGSDINIDLVVQNSFLSAGNTSGMTASASAPTGTDKCFGMNSYHNTFFGCSKGFVVSGANFSATNPCNCFNSLFYVGSVALSATSSGQVVEDYNLYGCGTNLSTVTAGTHSKVMGSSSPTIAPLFNFGQERAVGQRLRQFMTPGNNSPSLGFGGNSTANTAVNGIDGANKPRPAGGASTVNASGYLERHDTAVAGGSANADGATGDCYKLAGPSDFDLVIPVDNTSTTITIKQKTSAYVGSVFPQIELLANAEIGVTGQTITDSAANTSYTLLSLSAFTPTAKGTVTLRLKNRTADGAGIVYWDTVSVS